MGQVKEAVGSVTGNSDLKKKDKADQAKAATKNVGEDTKDAAHKVKDARGHSARCHNEASRRRGRDRVPSRVPLPQRSERTRISRRSL